MSFVRIVISILVIDSFSFAQVLFVSIMQVLHFFN